VSLHSHTLSLHSHTLSLHSHTLSLHSHFRYTFHLSSSPLFTFTFS
jgi:hypothetical protein